MSCVKCYEDKDWKFTIGFSNMEIIDLDKTLTGMARQRLDWGGSKRKCVS